MHKHIQYVVSLKYFLGVFNRKTKRQLAFPSAIGAPVPVTYIKKHVMASFQVQTW
jgi:hypothetical protein